MKFSDKPIRHPRDDSFGYTRFAWTLARQIDGYNFAHQGLVIGLEGEWGSGKSSVIELVIRFLKHLDIERICKQPIYPSSEIKCLTLDEIEEYTNIFEKIEHRIADIERHDRNATFWYPVNRINEFRNWLDNENEVHAADFYWRCRIHQAEREQNIVVRFTPWLYSSRIDISIAFYSELARSLEERLGDSLATEIKMTLGKVLARIAELAPATAAGVDAVTGTGLLKYIGTASAYAKGYAEKLTSGRSLDALRRELKRFLGKLDRKRIIVVMDDLDRLSPQEAEDSISLVKSNGDLPNILYLMSYNRNVLSDLLSRGHIKDGNAFLEKIIQIPFEMPIIDKSEMGAFLSNLLKRSEIDISKFDQRRLSYAWEFAISKYIVKPRDAVRLVNAFALKYNESRNQRDPVIDLTIETLRLYDYLCYNYVRDNIEDAL